MKLNFIRLQAQVIVSLYFGLFYLYFWRAPPVVPRVLDKKRPRAKEKLVAFFYFALYRQNKMQEGRHVSEETWQAKRISN